MKEATLSIIASKLLGDDQKNTLQKIFKIMDGTGDGKLGKEEIQIGFKQILNQDISAEDCMKIINNVD